MRNNNANVISILMKTFLSISYVYVFVSVPSVLLKDRLPYEILASEASTLISLYGSSLFLHEPLFLLINIFLTYFIDANIVPYIFVFFITASIIFFLNKLSSNFMLFFLGILSFLYVPGLFHLQLVTLRQGLATVLLIWIILYIKSEKKILFLIFLLSFIHESFTLFFVIYFFYFLTQKFLKNKVNQVLVVSFCVSSILFFSYKIGSLIGIYQLNYIENEVSGFLGFFLYLVIFLYLLLDINNKNLKNKKIYDLSIIFMLIGVLSFFTTSFLGRYSISFFAFVYLALVQKNNFLNYIFISLLILIYIYQFYSGAVLDLSLLSNNLNDLRFPWAL